MKRRNGLIKGNKVPMLFALFVICTLVPAYAQKNKTMEKSKTTGYAPVNGLKMYYEVYGSGDIPLVLIHGGGSTIETSFGHILPMFSGKIIAMELQAHGRTSDRDAPESFEQDADDVAALLQHLKIKKANFLGFSNGATTSVQLAIRHPEIMGKIIVIAGATKRSGFIPGFFDGMQHATIDNMPAPLKEAFLKLTPDQEKLMTMFRKDKQRMIDFKDISDDLVKSIKAPALIMTADKDVSTVEHNLELSRLIPNARLAILPGTHGSYIGEIGSVKPESKLPEVTVILVEEFLND